MSADRFATSSTGRCCRRTRNPRAGDGVTAIPRSSMLSFKLRAGLTGVGGALGPRTEELGPNGQLRLGAQDCTMRQHVQISPVRVDSACVGSSGRSMRSQICPRPSKVSGSEATGSAVGVRSVAPPSRNCAGRAQGRVLKRLNLARRNFSNPYLVSSFFDYIVHLAGWWDPSPIYPTPFARSKGVKCKFNPYNALN
jgi:hypothetical protein